jgi:integrase
LRSVPAPLKSEQLNLKVRQVDFFRNLIVFDKTKSGRSRMVDMNSDIRQILLELCRGKQPDDYVWSNPTTGGPYTEIKHAFPSACSDAKIEGLVWHDPEKACQPRSDVEDADNKLGLLDIDFI